MHISIHALLAESDSVLGHELQDSGAFLSTLSLRRATQAFHRYMKSCHISIHALLAESDLFQLDARQIDVVISIHALLAESDGPPPLRR